MELVGLRLLFTFIVAALVARTASTVVELTLAAPLSRHDTPAPQTRATTILDTAHLARMLGLRPVEPPPAEDQPALPRSPLRVTLLGTLVSDAHPDWSIASLYTPDSHRTATLMTGDLLLGVARLVDIQRGRVIVLRDGRREFIDATPGGPLPEARPVGITRVSGNDFELVRAELDRALANIPALSADARIVPAFKDGRALGFKLFAIRPDSLFARLGLENGDLVRRINGLELTSADVLLDLYGKLRTTTRFEVELERNGVTHRTSYSLR